MHTCILQLNVSRYHRTSKQNSVMNFTLKRDTFAALPQRYHQCHQMSALPVSTRDTNQNYHLYNDTVLCSNVSICHQYYNKLEILQLRYPVAEWYGAGLAIARSRVRIPRYGDARHTPIQPWSWTLGILEANGNNAVKKTRAIPPGSVNEYQRKLGSKRPKAGIPRDTLAPYPWSCGLGWCPAEGYETEISAAPWALRLGKELYFFHYNKLEIWGRAQFEAARHRKSDWKYNLVGCSVCKNLRQQHPLQPKYTSCKSPFGWVNIYALNLFVSGPKCTKIFFAQYSQSKSEFE